MTACEIQCPAPRPALTAPPEDVIAILAHYYCVIGLTPTMAWRSALADYRCCFQDLDLSER